MFTMLSKLVTQTAQAAVLSVTSNILAQVIVAYRYDVCCLLCATILNVNSTNDRVYEQKPFRLDSTLMLKFAFYTILNTPPNYLWQQYLEKTFPSEKLAPAPSGKTVKLQMTLDFSSVFKKFLLDQTLGATVNTILFITAMAGMNGASTVGIAQAVKEDFWPLTLDGYKLWPLFSLVSFLWIPVDKRVLAGCAVGMGWGIYLSLFAAGK